MKTIEFLNHLRDLGIEVKVQDGRLICKAPKGEISGELRTELGDRKAEIISFLSQVDQGLSNQIDTTGDRQSSSLSTAPVLPPILSCASNESIPLSFAQARLWFLDQLNPASGFYNIPNAFHLQGQLNYPVLQQSIQEIVRRHAALRTTFTTRNGETVQVITPEVTVDLKDLIDIPVIDLQNLPDPEQAIETRQVINSEAAKPFNITQESLLRVLLIQQESNSQILVITMHHIVSDGWSMGVFIEELTTLYKAFVAGQPSPLPELKIQYPDFTLWQHQGFQKEVLQTQITYWKKQLANAPALLELPCDCGNHSPRDRPRPAQQTYRGATQSFVLNPELSREINLLSRKYNVTPFMTLLAAFQVLIFRYTQTTDFCIGTPVANRNQPEIEGLIGFFVNTLVLRADLTNQPSFEELLKRVRDTALDAYAHQDVPFDQLVEALQPLRSLSYSPLFQIMFVLQNAGNNTLELPGLTITPVAIETNTAKYDLILSMEETEQGLVGNWEYSTDLFDDTTITRMAGHFQMLLQGIVSDPQTKISHLPLLTEPELQLLQSWNQTETDYPRNASIPEVFVTQVEQTPEAIALIFDDEQITYQELNQRANQLAHHLQTLGVQPEVTVGLCVERSIAMIVATLAILKAGGVYVPLDPSYPGDRLAFMAAQADVKILLTETKLISQLPPHQAQILCLDTSSEILHTYSPENPPSQVTGENLAYIMFTSGSTGQPKGVCVPHRGVVRLVKNTNYARLDSQETFLQLAPTAFDASTLEIWGSLLNGAKLAIAPPHKISLSELGRLILRHQVTTLWLTAGLFHLMVEERLEALKPLRQLLAGGDILSAPQVQKFLAANPDCQLINGYGPTENTTFTCCYPIPKASREKSIPIGRPIANTQVYILDPHLQLVPIGVRGELYVGGDGLARGYLDRPDLTADKFIPHPFGTGKLYKTGDAARYLTDGTIEFEGRLDNQVKIRGFRIELGEIESVLAQYPGMQQTVVVAKEEALGDKSLIAYLTPITMGEEIPHLRQFLQQKLPEYMRPSRFIAVEALPLNAVGKVDRRTLSDLPKLPELAQPQPDETIMAPRDEVEAKLLELWSQVLDNKNIGIRDRFFEDLGGSSLKAARLFLKIETEFGKVLPLAILYEAPTIEGIAKILRQQEWQPTWSSLVPIQLQGSKIPLFCIHPGGGNVLCYRTLAPYLGTDQPVYGLQSQGLDGQEEAIDDIRVMARNYLQEMQTVQATGPYLLAGYSFGGMVAYEIAQQLQDSGQEVAAVILFDTISTPSFLKKTTLLEKLKLHKANLKKLNFPEQVGYFNHRLDLKIRVAKSKLKSLVYSLQGKKNPEAIAPHLIKIDAANYRAIVSYQTQPYSGKVVLFETIERPTDIHDDPSLGWSAFTKLEIIADIPGHHGTMLEEPYVAFLGKKLKVYLEQFNVQKNPQKR